MNWTWFYVFPLELNPNLEFLLLLQFNKIFLMPFHSLENLVYVFTMILVVLVR